MTVYIRDIQLFRDTSTVTALRHKMYMLYQWVDEIVDKDIILSFVEWRNSSTSNFKLRAHRDYINIYSNDLSVFTTLTEHLLDQHGQQLSSRIKYRYAQQIPNFEQNVIYQVSPKHKYRIYLSTAKRVDEQIESFKNYLEKYGARASKSLRYWLETYDRTYPNLGNWSWNHYSFDFDDEQLITLFLLSHDNWVGKVCRIEKR
jgi:hypothetical protein